MRSLSYIFGDNKGTVDSSMTTNGKIHKRDIALLFNRVRESIVAGIVNYQSVYGKHNPTDAWNKHCAHNDVWPTLKPILFRPGDIMECFC